MTSNTRRALCLGFVAMVAATLFFGVRELAASESTLRITQAVECPFDPAQGIAGSCDVVAECAAPCQALVGNPSAICITVAPYGPKKCCVCLA